MAKNLKKKAWKEFEITKIKLNPEQAVLACCNSTARNQVGGGRQCDLIQCGSGGVNAPTT